MATVDQGLRSQVQNIEATYGRPIEGWIEVVRTSGCTRHSEIVTMLKSEYGMSHGAANRVALIALDALNPKAKPADPEESLYPGTKGALLPIHARLMATVHELGTDIEIAPKRGYLSLRRRKQFAMIQPAAKHVDLGLVLPGLPVGERLESAATFNALFTHRVRIRSLAEVDDHLMRWLEAAYAGAA